MFMLPLGLLRLYSSLEIFHQSVHVASSFISAPTMFYNLHLGNSLAVCNSERDWFEGKRPIFQNPYRFNYRISHFQFLLVFTVTLPSRLWEPLEISLCPTL